MPNSPEPPTAGHTPNLPQLPCPQSNNVAQADNGPYDRRSARVERAARSLRGRLGWICCATGALLCALGWYGVSGERYTARQVPYLTSATAPGVALIVGGTVLLAAQRRNLIASNELERLSRQLEVLCQLLTEAAQNETAAETGAATGPGPGAAGDGGSVRPWLLAVPGGRTYHRFDCLLVQGRRDPERVMNGSAAAQGLRPCPLCEPPEA